MAHPLNLIIQREYFERVRRKSFIISTIAVPVLMLALMLAPAFFMLFSSPEKKVVQVVDHTGILASRLQGNDEIEFVNSSATADELRKNEDNEAILIIGSDAVENPKEITLLSRGSIAMMTDAYISSQLENAIEDVRLESHNILGLKEIIDSSKVDISLTTIRIDQDHDTQTSSEVSYFLSLILDMMLYMFIIIYGQMVMNSIIEEKNNRVLEIVVSSVKPFYLMMGKIIGVGLVAITQILIWGALIGIGSAVAAPFLTPESLGPEVSSELSGAIGQLTDVGFIISLFIYIILFFIGGFLFYASIYAAIGSAVSNVQDAGQLSTVATMPVIIGIIGSMSIINDPGSTLAFWLSIIPFTSPMCMMARLPFGTPFWEIALSLVVLYISFIFMIWLCGKIYRIGIFMYGKKPTLIEILKWAKIN